jgi:hypothetical protein
MVRLARDSKVIQLAKDLGLNWRGDCLVAISEFALRGVERIIGDSPIHIDSLDTLRRIVADKFRVKLEFIRDDVDVETITCEYPDFHPRLRQRLMHEFLHGTTEGITLERDAWDPRRFQYLAVVDARGTRAPRAYFTGWHEITHLLVHPTQLRFPGFRRTPVLAEREKDPLESVVDHVTGKVAFYPPFFRPAVERALAEHGGCTFAALDAAREAAVPDASLFATAMGSLPYINAPTVFVAAEMRLKAAEQRLARSPQHALDFAQSQAEERLRVSTVVPNELILGSDVVIRRNMRVPAHSVLAQAYASPIDVTLEAEENQAWWETSREGSLPDLPLRVQAIRRGRFVYGLISPT